MSHFTRTGKDCNASAVVVFVFFFSCLGGGAPLHKREIHGVAHEHLFHPCVHIVTVQRIRHRLHLIVRKDAKQAVAQVTADTAVVKPQSGTSSTARIQP